VQTIPCSALLSLTWEVAPRLPATHLLGTPLTAPKLNAYSSAADVLASAWKKEPCRSAGSTTLFVCAGLVTHTAILSSKAHFGSDINSEPAILGVGSLP